MNIECLEYFQKIAELKSISRAANSSHISQSALSQQMQKLEESLGYKLFIRSNRGVELTESGNIVLKYTDNIIRTYNKMMEELKEQGKQQHIIKIEAAWTIATYCLPCAVYRMMVKFPNHRYDLVSNHSEKIEQDVLNDICEVGFTTSSPADKLISCHEVINEKAVLVSLINYNIPDIIELADLTKYPLLLLKGECIIKERLEEHLREKGYELDDLKVIFELDSTEAVKSMVLKGLGISFLPYSAIKNDLTSRKLKTIKIPDVTLGYSIYLITKKSSELSTSVKEFVEGFKELGNNICC